MKICQCEYCEKLSGNQGQDYARNHLKKILVDNNKWRVLYKCPEKDFYWEEYFPHSEEHGGGVPEFVRISEEDVAKEFRNVFNKTAWDNMSEYENLKKIMNKNYFIEKIKKSILR